MHQLCASLYKTILQAWADPYLGGLADLSAKLCFTILSVILIVGLPGLLGLQMMRRRDKLGRRLLLLDRQGSWLWGRVVNVSSSLTHMLMRRLWWADSHRQPASSC